MARIRTVKPEFWSSEQVMECSPVARLLFIGLWNFCDDHGRHPFSPRTIKALVFPSDDITADDVHGMLNELSVNGLIEVYAASGREYIQVTGWRHQKINRPQPYKYPQNQMVTNRGGDKDAGGEAERLGDSVNDHGIINECSLTEKEKEKEKEAPLSPPAVEKPEAVATDEIARRELVDLKAGIVAAFRGAGSMTLAPDTYRAERWVAQGYRPAVILAVVREVLARHPNVKSLSYFDNPIREAHENAAKQPAAASSVDEGKRLNYLRSMVQEWQREPTTWPTRLGPRPDDAGCTVPANILAEFGIQPRERRAA